MQSNMYLQGTKRGIFVTYDPRIKIGNSGYYEAFLDRNEDDIALMLVQLDKAYTELKAIGFGFDIDVEDMFYPNGKPEIEPENLLLNLKKI